MEVQLLSGSSRDTISLYHPLPAYQHVMAFSIHVDKLQGPKCACMVPVRVNRGILGIQTTSHSEYNTSVCLLGHPPCEPETCSCTWSHQRAGSWQHPSCRQSHCAAGALSVAGGRRGCRWEQTRRGDQRLKEAKGKTPGPGAAEEGRSEPWSSCGGDWISAWEIRSLE